MSQEITVSRIGRALHIRLDRAGKHNAVTQSVYEAMVEAIAEAEADETSIQGIDTLTRRPQILDC
jgi:enoyl-CoA hydratase/carnithine racemase